MSAEELRKIEHNRILENLGFVEVRQRSSHKQMRHEDGRGTTVPCHKGRDISTSAKLIVKK